MPKASGPWLHGHQSRLLLVIDTGDKDLPLSRVAETEPKQASVGADGHREGEAVAGVGLGRLTGTESQSR